MAISPKDVLLKSELIVKEIEKHIDTASLDASLMDKTVMWREVNPTWIFYITASHDTIDSNIILLLADLYARADWKCNPRSVTIGGDDGRECIRWYLVLSKYKSGPSPDVSQIDPNRSITITYTGK